MTKIELHPEKSDWWGIYKDEYGWLYEIHEWGDWFDESDIKDYEPDGAVYFEIYQATTPIDDIVRRDADSVDGAVIGYAIGDALEDVLADWIPYSGIKKVA